MAKAYVDGGDTTRVLLWRTESDIRSIGGLSPDGAHALAAHWSRVSTERALVERTALVMLQNHGRVAVVDELDATDGWVRSIYVGETPAGRSEDFLATLHDIPPESWAKAYGGDKAQIAFERRATDMVVRLAGAVLLARTAEHLSDVEVIAMLLEIITEFTAATIGAWAGWVTDERVTSA